MKKGLLKKILLSTSGVFFLLVAVLAIHIYIVTRPKAPTANTRIMARIDIKQPISQGDADKITTWLYQQKGIDHVLCNPKTEIVVFTFFPIKTTGDQIVKDFKSSFSYNKAQRYIPTEEELKGGCPVASTSFAYKTYNFFKRIF
jgi:hypothetical protein